jgi:Fe-S cluster biosynthesis and repair protein YggX
LKQGKVKKDNFIIRAPELNKKSFNGIKKKVCIEYLASLIRLTLQEPQDNKNQKQEERRNYLNGNLNKFLAKTTTIQKKAYSPY